MMTDPKSTEPKPLSDSHSQGHLCQKIQSNTEQNSINRRKKRWYLLGGLTGATVALLGGGWFYGQYFVKTQIAPLVSQGLTYFLNRPVKIGELESITFYSLRFGPSELFPVGKDHDHVTFKALEVTFNPLDYLSKKKLFIEATVIEPNIYLEQGKNGNWLQTPLAPFHPDFVIDLQQLKLKQASIKLLTRNHVGKFKEPVAINLDYAKLDLRQILSQYKLNFALKGQLADRGQLVLNGLWDMDKQNVNLSLRGNELNAIAISNLLPLPLPLQQGNLDANLEVKIRQQFLTDVQGVATLHNLGTSLAVLPQPLKQIEGPLRFKGTTVFLEGVSGQLGLISTQAFGQFDLHQGFDLKVKVPKVAIAQLVKTFELPKPSFNLSGNLAAQLQIKGNINKPLVFADLQSIDNQSVQFDRLNLQGITAKVSLKNTNLVVSQFQSQLVEGGKVRVTGFFAGEQRRNKLSFSHFQGLLQGQDLAVKTLAKRYGYNLPIALNRLSGSTEFIAVLPSDQKSVSSPPFLRGAGGITKSIKETIDHKSIISQLSSPPFLRGSGGINQPISKQKGKVTLSSGNWQLSGAAGKTSITDLNYQEGHWQGNVNLINLEMSELPGIAKLDRQLRQGQLQGQLQVKGYQSNLEQLQANGNLNWLMNGGKVEAKNIVLNQQQLQAQLTTQNLHIRPWQTPLNQEGLLTGQVIAQGKLKNFQEHLQAIADLSLQVADGKIVARNLILNGSQFQTNLSTEGLALNRFNHQLKGKVVGQIAVKGQLESGSPQLAALKGNLDFSQGLGALNQPLKTLFQWQGDRLQLEKVSSKNINAKGEVTVNLAALNQPRSLAQAIQQINLSVNADQIPLAQLMTQRFALFPDAFSAQKGGQGKLNSISGKLNFAGKVQGRLSKPNVIGNLNINNFQLGRLVFDPYLTGKVSKTGQGLSLKLQGKQDILALGLDAINQPTSFLWKQPILRIEGTREGQQFWVTAQNIPFALLRTFSQIGADQFHYPALANLASYPLEGSVSGQFGVDLPSFAIKGDVAIAAPNFASFKMDKLTSKFAYNEGKLSVEQGILQKQKNQYQFNGNVELTSQQPHFQGAIALPSTEIQNLLETLQIFRLEDIKRVARLELPNYAQAQSLYPPDVAINEPLIAVGSPQADLFSQLDQLSKINSTRKQLEKQRASQARLPELEDLRGQLSGKLEVEGVIGGDVALGFNFQGKDWQWGTLAWDELELRGKWQQGSLTLAPLRLQGKQGLILLSGQMGRLNQQADLRIEKVPLQPLAKLFALSENQPLTGEVNANITLEGSRANPKAKGKLAIADAIFNQSPLQSVTGDFNYQQGRLDFKVETILAQKTNPLTLQGSVPYVFPFASVLPDSDRFQVGLQINDDSLKILNLLTNQQLAWQSGQGQVIAKLEGRIDPQTQGVKELTTEGLAEVKNATISAHFFPQEPLTNVNAKLTLDFNHLSIQQLTGQFSGGDLAIAGDLAFKENSDQNQQPQKPLLVSLNNLKIKLVDVYEGNVRGQIQITGNLTKPDISGNLELVKGEIALGDSVPVLSTGASWQSNTEFKNFILSLGEDVRVIRSPILDFLAKGQLTLNGAIDNLQPDGRINLTGGQINLFASQLRLVGGEENLVHFYPGRGLDPYLNLQLTSAVTETNRNLAAPNPLSSEIDLPFSANRENLQSVRITAIVQGYASQLSQSLQLTSVPRRSQREIVSLLGGDLANTLGQGDSTSGLANLASSAVLGPVQGRIGEALGLSQFRIFSTPLINDKERTQANQLGIAAEAGIDLTNDLSLSVQKIVNADRPPQWGMKYRINENLRVRGSSNFADDSRGIIEYEQRF